MGTAVWTRRDMQFHNPDSGELYTIPGGTRGELRAPTDYQAIQIRRWQQAAVEKHGMEEASSFERRRVLGHLAYYIVVLLGEWRYVQRSDLAFPGEGEKEERDARGV